MRVQANGGFKEIYEGVQGALISERINQKKCTCYAAQPS